MGDEEKAEKLNTGKGEDGDKGKCLQIRARDGLGLAALTQTNQLPIWTCGLCSAEIKSSWVGMHNR
jgi:hypothetical protein